MTKHVNIVYNGINVIVYTYTYKTYRGLPMINTNTVKSIIQDEINKSTDSSVTEVLFSIKSRIKDLEENDLNNMFEDFLQREIVTAEEKRSLNMSAEAKLLSEMF